MKLSMEIINLLVQPYTIKVYRLNEKDAGPIYENTQDSNTWNLDLDIGQYQADITDSCGHCH